MSDPRVFFSSERTLLSWVRTGVTIMGLGFVVARFGLFLQIVSPNDAVADFDTGVSANVVGPGLVLLGAVAVLGAFFNHRSYVRTLPRDDVPQIAAPWLTSLLAILIAAAGLLLAAYLVAG